MSDVATEAPVIAGAPRGAPAIHVDAVRVGPDRIDVDVSVPSGALRTGATESLRVRLLELLPGVARHSCVNGRHLGFLDEAEDTEVAHLFEHIVLEVMAQAGSPRALRGSTVWDSRVDGPGVFHVSLEYDDDLVCLGAIKCAVELLGHLLGDAARPDVQDRVGRLRCLRATPTA